MFEKIGIVKKPLLVTLIPLLVFFAAMLAIEHKETRFLLPILPGAYFFLGFLTQVLFSSSVFKVKFYRSYFDSVFQSPKRWILRFGIYLWLLLGSFYLISKSVSTPLYLSNRNISELETIIYDSHKISLDGTSCILLVDFNWAWTHGYLILGAPVNLITTDIEDLDPAQLSTCNYAILRTGDERDFKFYAGQEWENMKKTQNGYILYERVGKRL